jgi:hypothetical protein
MALLLPEYLQTKKYSAGRVRGLLMDLPIQAGVRDPSGMKVSQRSAGANKTVDIAAGAGWVKGSFSARQGLYHVFNDAVYNLTIPDNATGNPRLDQIVCRINDTTDGGGVADNTEFFVVQGTPTAGATLDNRNGAEGTLPTSSLLIADVLAGAGFSSITNSVIRDRRPWSWGAYRQIIRTSNAAAGNDYTTTSTTYVDVDSTNLKPRIECSGVPLRITFYGGMNHSASDAQYGVVFGVDGTSYLNDATNPWTTRTTGATQSNLVVRQWDYVPTPGSHQFSLMWKAVTAGTVTMLARATMPMQFTIQELLRQSAVND